MRISSIGAWADCEVMALQSPPRPAGRTNVAAFVGTLAHAELASIMVDERPARFAYDTLTKSDNHAIIQAHAIAEYARDLLTAQGWGVLGREEEVRRDELVGHLDIRAWHSDHGEAIIDLKTGQGVGAAWLQVGGYLTLYAQKGTGLYSQLHKGMIQGGVLHVPRVAINKDVKGTLELRSGRYLARAWDGNMGRIQEVLDGEAPTYSPGIHCGRCHVADCPVRVKDVRP